jgi:hypothetical protein
VSSSTVPDPMALKRHKLRMAQTYVDMFGWKIFVLGRDKTPLPNCSDCAAESWQHIREDCSCLTCHGFYAATDDLDALDDMVTRHPTGWLAARTGAASRLVVLDFEASADAQGRTGLDTLDEFEQWSGGVELPPTLRQRTQSGGLHLLYRLLPGVVVKGRNRLLPQTDVKAEGGYVALPTPGRDERSWVDDSRFLLTNAPDELLDWLARTRGRSGGGGGGGGGSGSGAGESSVSVDGYDYQRFVREGCPGGARDQFFNEALFRMRKNGISHALASDQVRRLWEMCKQPPEAEWYMPWDHVAYKLDRVWQTVAPPVLPSWSPVEVGTTESGEQIVKQGRAFVVRSKW